MDILDRYAEVIVKVGANVQENQIVVINSPVKCYEFARKIVKKAYEAKASRCLVKWSDEIINRDFYLNASDEVLEEVPNWLVEQFKYIVDNNACLISISSATPGLMKDVDPNKIRKQAIASDKVLGFYDDYVMASKTQWCVAAYPSVEWAKKVFPDLDEKEGYDKLMEAILSASRITTGDDPINEWDLHIKRIEAHNKMLNDYNFKSLTFKNSLGTNLTVGLVQNHIWGGGGEYSSKGIYFAPNIPTEETFTMPHSHNVNGVVYSSKPLNYQGKLIENFMLEFKDGEVIRFKAEKEEKALEDLLNTDSGSKRLGEVALISANSPISNSGILFYNTLFDENASCHLALGNAYPNCVKDGDKLPEEEMIKLGYNKSMVHVDFMFGTSDLSVIGETQDGKKVIVFENGNFVF